MNFAAIFMGTFFYRNAKTFTNFMTLMSNYVILLQSVAYNS